MSADLPSIEKKRVFRVVGDSWALDKVGYDHVRLSDFERELPGYAKLMLRNTWARATILALFANRYDVLAAMHASPLTKRLIVVFGLLGIRRLVLLETIIWNVGNRPNRKQQLLGWLLRRSSRALHVMVKNDEENYHKVFGIPAKSIKFIPWPMITGDNFSQVEPLDLSERKIILASGRANCDWETLLDAAEGQGWPLVIVCSNTDLARINGNPKSRNVDIRCEISKAEHERLVKSARIYVLCLGEANISSGQIRLSHCSEFRTPLVASDVYGLRGYLEDGVTGVAVSPSDKVALRETINNLIDDLPQLQRMVEVSADYGKGKTVENYARQLIDVILFS